MVGILFILTNYYLRIYDYPLITPGNRIAVLPRKITKNISFLAQKQGKQHFF